MHTVDTVCRVLELDRITHVRPRRVDAPEVATTPTNEKRPRPAASEANQWPILGYLAVLAAKLPRSVLRNLASASLVFSSLRIAE